MDRREEVLGIGAAIVDSIVYVEESVLDQLGLVKGSMVVYEDLTPILNAIGHVKATVPGGSCANVIRGLAELGWTCALAGKVGDDSAGRWLFNDLYARGIDPYYVTGKGKTGRVLCLVTPGGERTMCSLVGAGAEMTGEDLQPALFEGKGLVVIEGYTLMQKDLTRKAMELARGLGADVSFDLGNFQLVENKRDEIWSLLKEFVTIAFGNESEAVALTGSSAKEACQLIGAHARYAVVTVGANGCFACQNGQEPIHMPAIPVPSVVDTTGAGDSFSTGFLDGALRGKPLDLCVHQGLLLAAAVIQQEGVALSVADWNRLRAAFA